VFLAGNADAHPGEFVDQCPTRKRTRVGDECVWDGLCLDPGECLGGTFDRHIILIDHPIQIDQEGPRPSNGRASARRCRDCGHLLDLVRYAARRIVAASEGAACCALGRGFCALVRACFH